MVLIMEKLASPDRLRVGSRICAKSGYVSGKAACALLPSERFTSSPVLVAPGIGFRSVELIQEKMVVLAAMPSTKVSNTTAVKPGDLPSSLRLYRTSCQKDIGLPRRITQTLW